MNGRRHSPTAQQSSLEEEQNVCSFHRHPLSECFAMIRNLHALEPEKKALLAILEENIDCFERYLTAKDKGGRVLFQDAADWIFEEGRDWQFSFDNVCNFLGVDPAALRQSLRRWQSKILPERATAQFPPDETDKGQHTSP